MRTIRGTLGRLCKETIAYMDNKDIEPEIRKFFDRMRQRKAKAKKSTRSRIKAKKSTRSRSVSSSSSSTEAWLRSEGRMSYESYMI